MSKVNVIVWHNPNGQIVAIGRHTGRHKVVPLASADQVVLETQIEEESLGALHMTHSVDTQRKELIKRPRPKAAS